MVNTKTEFPRGISDQVISLRAHDGECERASWSGPKASSSKRLEQQATSFKPQATSVKLQATSVKLQDLITTKKFHGT